MKRLIALLAALAMFVAACGESEGGTDPLTDPVDPGVEGDGIDPLEPADPIIPDTTPAGG